MLDLRQEGRGDGRSQGSHARELSETREDGGGMVKGLKGRNHRLKRGEGLKIRQGGGMLNGLKGRNRHRMMQEIVSTHGRSRHIHRRALLIKLSNGIANKLARLSATRLGKDADAPVIHNARVSIVFKQHFNQITIPLITEDVKKSPSHFVAHKVWIPVSLKKNSQAFASLHDGGKGKGRHPVPNVVGLSPSRSDVAIHRRGLC